MDYRQSGVDIDAAAALVASIKPIVKSTRRPGALGMIGGFAALFDPKAAGFIDPIMVTSTDGVGTKLEIAIAAKIHSHIGIDLVAMCVNDLVVQGAEPLSFLDYFATGKLDTDVAKQVIAGIALGCVTAGCVLAGGETAEMPGVYPKGHYDLAGFAMGAAERGTLLPNGVAAGDILIGLGSSGVHSNGFSLVRAILESKASDLSASCPFFPTRSLAAALLTPTRIYVKTVFGLHKEGLLKGAAHITGGGLIENLPRVLPEGVRAVVDKDWVVPKVFEWLRKEGEVSNEEMLRTFNCGIGMVLVVAPDHQLEVCKLATSYGEKVYVIGHLEAGDQHQIALPPDDMW